MEHKWSEYWNMKIDLSCQIRPSDDVLLQEVGGEAVLLDLASECYFGLEAVGTRIWELLQQNSSLQQTYDCLRAEYDVEPDRLRTDLLALVEQMLEAGLVRVA